MFRKRVIIGLSALVIASLVLTACSGGKQTDGENNNGTGTSEPAKGGEIVYSAPSDPDTFAPFWHASAYGDDVTSKIYGGGLMKISFDMKPVPDLAESFEVSPDNKTYTFKIRKGIKFTDGKEVTAEDFKFTYDILMSPDYAGPDKGSVASVESVTVKDSHTLEIKTKEVFAPFLYSTATWFPLPKHYLGAVPIKELDKSDLWKQPVSAGPWKLGEWKSGQYTLLERNDQFWETGKPGVQGGVVGPYADRIRIRVIPQAQTEMAALENGELSYKGSVEASFVDRLKTEFKDKLTPHDWNRLGGGMQQFNTEKFPTNIKEVRQALSYALNREAIIKGVMEDKAVVPNGPVPHIHWAYDSSLKGYPYDPAKATGLLEKAGFKKNSAGIYEKDGQPLKLQYVATKDSPLIDGIALQSKKDWNAVGVEVELIMVDFNTLLEKHLKPGDFHVSFTGQSFGVDPHSSFDLFNSRNVRVDANGYNSGSNRTRYKNAEYDALLDQGKTTLDQAARKPIYAKMQQILVEDAPVNWIYVNKYTDFAKKDLKGVVNWDGYGMSFINQWYLSEK